MHCQKCIEIYIYMNICTYTYKSKLIYIATEEFTRIDMGLSSESVNAHTRSNASNVYYYTP